MECVESLVAVIEPSAIRLVVGEGLVINRKLDHGNPNAGNIGADFGRLGLSFWDEVRHLDRRTSGRMLQIDELNRWRNAIAPSGFRSW